MRIAPSLVALALYLSFVVASVIPDARDVSKGGVLSARILAGGKRQDGLLGSLGGNNGGSLGGGITGGGVPSGGIS
ncbi:hypothetical protein J3R82DRAFT_8393 [Butyriboletus roseoflavus]|nr:hypothetical protein J3R82DRAFT_8393 [Butyriboletus roseoflavus]